jgi:hypothetical protein
MIKGRRENGALWFFKNTQLAERFLSAGNNRLFSGDGV